MVECFRGSGQELRIPGKNLLPMSSLRLGNKDQTETLARTWCLIKHCRQDPEERPDHIHLHLCLFPPHSLYIPELFLFLFFWGACRVIPATHSITPAKH